MTSTQFIVTGTATFTAPEGAPANKPHGTESLGPVESIDEAKAIADERLSAAVAATRGDFPSSVPEDALTVGEWTQDGEYLTRTVTFAAPATARAMVITQTIKPATA